MSRSWEFQPGNDLGKGRPQGARNKSSYELRDRLKARGDRDPAEFLSEVASNENEPKELRLTAANYLMPYYHSKLGATPVPPPLQYVEQAINLPRPTTLAIALDNIARLTEMKARGQLDFATADSFINDNRIIADKLIDEEKLRAQVADPNKERSIRIEGGLPSLPGTNITMPQLNGHEVPAVTHIERPEARVPPDYNAGDPPGGDFNGGSPPTDQDL
jgi:hypothetical protein